MDWLTGMLTGYANRSRKIEDDKFLAAREAAVRENQVFRDLLNSKDKRIASMAATGLILGSQPQRRSKGIAGWMGEMESNPIYPQLLEYMQTPQKTVTEEPYGGLPSRQSQGVSPIGGLPPAPTSSLHPSPTTLPTPPPAPPPPAGAAALPATSPTQAGAAPVQVAPPPAPPGAAGAGPAGPGPTTRELLESQTAQNQAAQQATLPATPIAQPPPPPPSLAGGLPPSRPFATAGPIPPARQPPPVGVPPGTSPDQMTTTEAPPPPGVHGTLRTERWDLPRAYPSQSEQLIDARRAQIQGDFQALRDMYLERGDSPEVATAQAAEDVVAMHQRAIGATTFRSMELEWTDEAGIEHRELGFVDQRTGQYLDNRHQPITGNVTRAVPYSAMNAGQFVTQALAAMGFSRIDYMNDPQIAAAVNARADQLREQATYSSGTGAGRARFEAPLTVPQAQEGRLPVGTRSSDVAGQTIPTGPQADRRIVLNSMVGWLDQIDQALDVLPQANTLGGLAPGAAIAIARRVPEYRVQYAILDSAINQILASLSRTVQQNVGTQTELDARRAMDTLAVIQGNILNPLTGDTQESARARLAVTRLYLQDILAKLPVTPVPGGTNSPPPETTNPNANPNPADAAGGKAIRNADGSWSLP